jgi:hypothetical protein
VNSSEAVHGTICEEFHLLWIRDIDFQRKDFGTCELKVPRDRAKRLVLNVGEHKPHPFWRKTARQGLADPTRRPGDHSHFIYEIPHAGTWVLPG